MGTYADLNDYLKNLPARIVAAPLDQQIAYYSIIAGIILILLWIFLKLAF